MSFQPQMPTVKRKRSSTPSLLSSGVSECFQKRPQQDFVEFWVERQQWPKAFFDVMPGVYLLAKPKVPSSTTSGLRQTRSHPYGDPDYVRFLTDQGIFLYDHPDRATRDSTNAYQCLLEQNPVLPKDTWFNDDVFELTCQRISTHSEAGIIRTITELIVPSAEGAISKRHLTFSNLVESFNEGWDNSVPLHKPRPQPDHAVGYPKKSFSKDQMNRLTPFVGGTDDTSYFKSTSYMYFPFLTCEVKGCKGDLEAAEQQNAHSMTVALRGVVELFRCIGREKELNREILGFSIAHNHRCVRIYGHYPVIEEDTKYYRHLIYASDFASFNGKERWTSYKFVMSVYAQWAPSHLKRLCSAIDELPNGVSSDVPQQLIPTLSESTRLPQVAGDIDGQISSFTYPIQRQRNRPGLSDSQYLTAQEPAEGTKISRKRRRS